MINDNFFITNKKFSKNDILFKNYIIWHIYNKKSKKILLNENELKKIIILGSYDNSLEFINKFKEKYYSFKFNDISGFFYIIDSFCIKGNIFEFQISNTFFNIISNKNNLLNKYNINNLIKISNKYVLNLYLYIQNEISNISKNSVKISIDKIKKIFEISKEQYQRFYDLELNVIKPALKELNTIINFDISYSKIKKGDSKNNKILGIEIIINKNTQRLKLENIYENIQNLNVNIAKIIEISNYYIEMKNISYVLDNINYAILHNSNNLEEFIINCIENDAINTRFENKIKKYTNEYCIVLNKNEDVNNLIEYKKFIIKQIKEFDDKNLSSLVLFFNDIIDNLKNNPLILSYLETNIIYKNIFYSLNKYKEFEFKQDNLILIGEFNINLESKFCILKKK